MLTKQIFNFYSDSISFTPTFSKMKALEHSIVLKWNHGEQILCLCTVFESAVQIRVSTCCQQIPGRLPNQEFQVLGQMACMVLAHIRQENSLRDIDIVLNAHANKLYHIGIKQCPKSTLADAN